MNPPPDPWSNDQLQFVASVLSDALLQLPSEPTSSPSGPSLPAITPTQDDTHKFSLVFAHAEIRNVALNGGATVLVCVCVGMLCMERGESLVE